MVTAKAKVVDLETVETHQNQTSELDKAWYPEAKGMGICEYPKRLLAHSQKSDFAKEHHQWPAKGIWLYLFHRLLQPNTLCKLRNRRVPDGTHGGVRGREIK